MSMQNLRLPCRVFSARTTRLVILTIALIANTGLCFAAEGSEATSPGDESGSNIVLFRENFTLTVSGKYNIVSFGDRMTASYEADKPWAIGLGLRYKFLSASFSIPLYKTANSKPFGTFDFQINSYPGRFFYSLFCRRYQGFYRDAAAHDLRDVDLDLFSAGVAGGWVLDHEAHSLAAVYSLSARQQTSSGSVLLGFGVFYTAVHSRDGLIERYQNREYFVYGGPSAAYSYTFIFPRNFFLNLMAAAELNAGYAVGGKSWHFMPQLAPRLSFGCHGSSWSLSFTGDCRYLLILQIPEQPDGLLTSSMTVTFSYRF